MSYHRTVTLDATTATPEGLARFDSGNFVRVPDWEERVVPDIAEKYSLLVAQMTDTSQAETSDLFKQRADGLRVYLGGRSLSESGYFNAIAWSIVVGGGLTHIERRATLTHEVGHALSVNQIHYLPDGSHYIQSGVARSVIDKTNNSQKSLTGNYADWWLNEGLVDIATRKVYEQKAVTGYITGFILLSTLFEMSGDFETQLYRDLFFTGNSDDAIRVVDDMTYSGWAAEVGTHIHYMDTHSPDDNPDYNPVGEVAATLSGEMKAIANTYYQQVVGA